jgi:arginine decarboxylase
LFQGDQFVPKTVFFTSGKGVHREKLTSFEMALRDARIAEHNLVRVSSILPPRCEIVPREEGLAALRPGQVVFCVLSEGASNEPSRRVGSSVGLAIPADRAQYGYISEHHAFGEAEDAMGDYAEDLAVSMLATVLGLPLDPDEAWDARVEHWKLSGEIVRTQNHTVVAEVPEDGSWLTTVSAAVFCG